MTYTLVLTLSVFYNGAFAAMHSIDKIPTKEACEIAGSSFLSTSVGGSASEKRTFICIPTND